MHASSTEVLRACARGLCLLTLWGAVTAAVAVAAVPPFTQWVTDVAGALNPQEKAALETRLAAFAAAKGAQVAVLIVATTDEEPIEGYALRVAEAWKLGRKGIDDGALLVVAKDDRHLRIEVGYGLEGALPDAIAKRIIAETIVPHFKSGNFFAGVNAGVERILGVVSGETLPPPASRPLASSQDAIGLALFFAFFFAVLFRGMGRVNAIRVPLSAAASGGMTYLLTSFGFAAGISAFGAVIIAGLLGANIGGPGAGGWVSHRRYGGFPGGFGGGGFGGGFGGGGGGSFGGGGASGSW